MRGWPVRHPARYNGCLAWSQVGVNTHEKDISVGFLRRILIGQPQALAPAGAQANQNVPSSPSVTTHARGVQLQTALATFGIHAQVTSALEGPVVTQYAIALGEGVRMAKVMTLLPDLARVMAVDGLRMSVIPSTSLLGVEVPNEHRRSIDFSEVIGPAYLAAPGHLVAVVGVGTAGETIYADLASMPNLLMAGATGSGKSVSLHGMLCSLLTRYIPSSHHRDDGQLELVLIDLKRSELALYKGSRYLCCPPVSTHEEARDILLAVREIIDERYELFEKEEVQNFEEFHRAQRRNHMPRTLVVIDELADLLSVNDRGKTSKALQRVVQVGRAAGIHVIAATQRPSYDVVSGIIKANFPARMSFRLASKADSQVILGMSGGEALLGNGDGLFLPSGTKPIRFQSAFVSAEMVRTIARR